MELVLALEHRFVRDQIGRVYSPDGGMTHDFFAGRYLKVFDRVHVMARVIDDSTASFPENHRVDGTKVSVIPIPHYIGLWQYFRKYRSIRNIIRANAVPGRAYIGRIPGTIGTILAGSLASRKIPYGIELVGDPYDVFAPGVVGHPLRPFIRYKYVRNTKRIVKNAACAIYVTKKTLQKRYPVSDQAFATYASNVVLPKDSVADRPKRYDGTQPRRLVSVGSLEQMYKAPDVVLHAMAILNREGVRCGLEWIGDGKYRTEMEDLAGTLGIAEQVEFVGTVSAGAAVREYLDRSNLFLLVSRTEGLPRALIEAMARGLPCIGSQAGGIPELLGEEALVPVGNAASLALKIKDFYTKKELYEKQASKNLAAIAEFDEAELERRRTNCYQALKERSERNR